MFNEVVTGTNIVYYMMIAIGAIGVLAKAVNQITLRRLVRAAGNMPKSTHKLIKLVRAKYEHALMLHDRVENAEAFVEKYIYEYRGFLLRIHTWRQLELQSIWFSGILAAFGGIVWYMENGFCEQVYRYISLGAAEMVLLFVVSQLSDEQYKIEAAKNYMVDYLENVCAMRRRKARQSEKDQINIIQPETSQALRANGREEGNGAGGGKETAAGNGFVKGKKTAGGSRAALGRSDSHAKQGAESREAQEAPGLSISIEGEPRRARTGVSGDTEPLYESAEELARVAGIYEEEIGSDSETPPAYGNVTAMRTEPASEYEEAAGKEKSSFGYGGAPMKGQSFGYEGGAAKTQFSGYEGSAAKSQFSGYEGGAAKSQSVSGYGGAAAKGGNASPAYGSAAGKGVSASGAPGTTQMKRIPGRFQDVVQRMIEDTSEYEEVLEGPPLPDESSRPAGHPDMVRAEGESIPDKLRQAADYLEADASYGEGDEDDMREYDRARRKNRKKGDAARQVIRRTMKGNPELLEREDSTLKEEAIRQILEEFLA